MSKLSIVENDVLNYDYTDEQIEIIRDFSKNYQINEMSISKTCYTDMCGFIKKQTNPKDEFTQSEKLMNEKWSTLKNWYEFEDDDDYFTLEVTSEINTDKEYSTVQVEIDNEVLNKIKLLPSLLITFCGGNSLYDLSYFKSVGTVAFFRKFVEICGLIVAKYDKEHNGDINVGPGEPS